MPIAGIPVGYEQGASADEGDDDNIVVQGQQCHHPHCPHALLLSHCWTCEDKGEGEEINRPQMMMMISLHEGNIIIVVLSDVQG